MCRAFEQFSPAVLSLDNYYLPINEQTKDEQGHVNFDLPTALNREKLHADIQRLKQRKTLVLKEYQFNAQDASGASFLTVKPSPLIFVEGLFVLHYEEIRALLDFSIFMDVDFDIQLQRRLVRDIRNRGCSEESIHYQWNNHVLPSFEQFVLPYRSTADKIVDNTYDFNQTLEQIIHSLNEHIFH